ncbi:MAG: AAA family ATPase [Anaerolineae bacterium]
MNLPMVASAPGSVPSLEQAVAIAEGALPQVDPGRDRPILVLLSGLPGTGKSHFARLLAAQKPFLIVESDRIRKALFSPPDYSSAESALVHRTCHVLIDRKLAEFLPVIYDATNLIEHFREKAYRMAHERRAELVVVRMVAPERVVRKRLRSRGRERLQKRDREGRRRRGQGGSGHRSPEDRSDADWEVYRLLLDSEEPIAVPHLVVQATEGAEEGVARVLEALE